MNCGLPIVREKYMLDAIRKAQERRKSAKEPVSNDGISRTLSESAAQKKSGSRRFVLGLPFFKRKN